MVMQTIIPRELKPNKEILKSEEIGTYEQSFSAQKKAMMKNSKISKKYTEKQIDLLIKNAIIQKSLDRIEFLIRSGLRRGFHVSRYGMDEDEYAEFIRENVKVQMSKNGYMFALTKPEQEELAGMQEDQKKVAAEEAAKIMKEAMRGIFSSIQ